MKNFVSTFLLLTILFLLMSCSDKTTDAPQTVSSPVFNPPGGTYTSYQIVEILCDTEGAGIRYTTCGNDPTETSTPYSGALEIKSDTTLKARAYKAGWEASEIVTAQYLITIVIPGNMVLVEGGTFQPGHGYTVTLSPFYIAMYQVTQQEYESVMGTNPSYFNDHHHRPVEQVSWFSAIEYCNRLSKMEGLEPCYSFGDYGTDPDNWPDGWNLSYQNHYQVVWNRDAIGYRLPTEAESLFAALGGVDSQGYIYSGSNNLDEVAWYWNNSGGTTHPVGLKGANELNTFDMSGNVWEWCWDIHAVYPAGSYDDPTGSDTGNYRVKRGGSAYSIAYICNVYYRHRHLATSTGNFNGFRVCRNVP